MQRLLAPLNETSIEVAVEVTADLFETEAATAAARCALVARSESLEAEYQFWLGVFKQLRSQQTNACGSAKLADLSTVSD